MAMLKLVARTPWRSRSPVFSLYHSLFPPLRGYTELFNRTTEMDVLRKLLKSDPQLTVVTGPVNSGKSLLMSKILQDIGQDKTVPILPLNLRNVSFNSVDSLVDTLTDKFTSWWKQFFQAGERLRLDGSAYGLGLGLGIDFRKANLPPMARLNYLLELLGNKLPPQSFWYGRQTPILLIDEANELNALLKDPDGHDALTNIFKWLVLNTKELGRFHSVLVSSDSFFHLWVTNYIGSSRFVNYVIGDLIKTDAERFWRERLLPQCDGVSVPLDFKHVYEVCGGNMFLMKRFFWEYVIRDRKMEPGNFFMITQERAKLTKALYTETDNEPLWSIMKKLVASKSGFVEYNDLCKEVGKAVVDALIRNSLLHLRPTVSLTNDLPDHKEGIPVVTAETPCGLLAMKRLVQENRAWLKKE